MARLFVVLLALASTVSATDRDNVNLRYELTQGDTCLYDVTTRSVISSAALPSSMATTVTSVFEIMATNTTKEQIGLDFAYKDIQVATKGAAAMGRADTSVIQPDDTTMKLSLILDRKGKILLAWPASALVLAYQSGSRLSGNGTQSSIRNIFLPYSPGAIRTGDTWSAAMIDTAYKLQGLLITQSTNIMKFDGVTDTLGVQCARILVHSDNVTLSGDSKPNGSAMSVSGSGTMSGVYYVVLQSGLLLTQTTKTEMDMSMTVAGQTEPAVEMHISSTILVKSHRRGE